jgi:hypothetical protein
MIKVSERQRVMSIIDRCKSPAMIEAVTRLLDIQSKCPHRKYNPTIKGGWKDGRDCRVCSDCGKIDILDASASDASAEPAPSKSVQKRWDAQGKR